MASSRLEFVPKTSLEAYFQQYHQIDIALDPFPYSGGTTTCDALWMGVPVVTLHGKTAVGRGGVTIYGQMGLSDWVSLDTAAYIDRACQLADNKDALAYWRRELRERMLNSPLTNGPAFARDFEQVMRTMWRAWCDDHQPVGHSLSTA